MAKINMLEDALVRDKENKADYMNMQIKRKLKAWVVKLYVNYLAQNRVKPLLRRRMMS